MRPNFGAEGAGSGTRCLRFARWVTPPGRKTRFRLLARLFRVGSLSHWVPPKGFFDASYIAFLLSQASPGASALRSETPPYFHQRPISDCQHADHDDCPRLRPGTGATTPALPAATVKPGPRTTRTGRPQSGRNCQRPGAGEGSILTPEAGQEGREVDPKRHLVWHGRAGVVPQMFFKLILSTQACPSLSAPHSLF
jgi:hypothetical protein